MHSLLPMRIAAPSDASRNNGRLPIVRDRPWLGNGKNIRSTCTIEAMNTSICYLNGALDPILKLEKIIRGIHTVQCVTGFVATSEIVGKISTSYPLDVE